MAAMGENEMEWYSNLYFGETAEKKSKKLIQKIESGKTSINTYLLTLPGGQKNQLEIIPAWNLKFWYTKKSCPMIIGLACGKEEALQLLCRITEEVFQKTGGVELRRYFESECMK